MSVDRLLRRAIGVRASWRILLRGRCGSCAAVAANGRATRDARAAPDRQPVTQTATGDAVGGVCVGLDGKAGGVMGRAGHQGCRLM